MGSNPRRFFSLWGILNGAPEKINVPMSGEILGLFQASLSVVLSLTGSKYTDDAIQWLSIWNMINGALLGLMPGTASKAWSAGEPLRDGTAGRFLVRGLGWFLMGGGVYFYTLSTSTGAANSKAMGYSMVTHFVYLLLSLFGTNEVNELGLDKNPFYVWLLEHICVIATLATYLRILIF